MESWLRWKEKKNSARRRGKYCTMGKMYISKGNIDTEKAFKCTILVARTNGDLLFAFVSLFLPFAGVVYPVVGVVCAARARAKCAHVGRCSLQFAFCTLCDCFSLRVRDAGTFLQTHRDCLQWPISHSLHELVQHFFAGCVLFCSVNSTIILVIICASNVAFSLPFNHFLIKFILYFIIFIVDFVSLLNICNAFAIIESFSVIHRARRWSNAKWRKFFWKCAA